jgi:hypothetical protein
MMARRYLAVHGSSQVRLDACDRSLWIAKLSTLADDPLEAPKPDPLRSFNSA